MRPALLGKLPVLKDGADGLDMGHDTGFQPALNGIPRQIISTGPSTASQQTRGVQNAILGQLSQLSPIHG